MLLDIGSTPLASCAHPVVRRRSRTLFSVPITLHSLIAGRLQESRGISLDISEGGMGALVEGSLKKGETVEVDFPLAGLRLNTVAIVHHASSARCGLEFLGLTDQEKSQIRTLADARKSSWSPRTGQ